MKIMGYLDAAKAILAMRQHRYGREQLREFLQTAQAFKHPASQQLSFGEFGWEFPYKGRRVFYDGDVFYLLETFAKEQYLGMDFRGRHVIDIGCAYGDTALWFMLNGAESVECYDVDAFKIRKARSNMEINGIKGVSFSYERLSVIPKISGAFVKMDIEGAEHELLKNSDLSGYAGFAVEVHGELGNVPRLLESAGYSTDIRQEKTTWIVMAKGG